MHRIFRGNAHVAGDAREGGKLVASRHGLCLRELVEERRLAHTRKANHRHASVSAPGNIETLQEAFATRDS